MNWRACLLAIGSCSCAALAGPLNPPAGPVAETGRFGPRVELSASNTPGDADSVFRITAPGSYYLGANLTGQAGKHGIEIASNDVTLDLMGFKLTGVGGSLDGITSDGVRFGVSVRDGIIRGWAGDGIGGEIVRGAIENISVFNCAGGGIVVGARTLVRECIVDFADGVGIQTGVSSMVIGCNVTSAAGGPGILVDNGSRVESCQARFSLGGIEAGERCQVIACAATNNTGGGIETDISGNVVDCLASDNAGHGIQCGVGSTVARCTALANSLNGVQVSDGSTVVGCTAQGNQGNAGIFASSLSTVRSCSAEDNANAGIRVNTGSVIEACTAGSNDGNGIQTLGSCRVSANSVSFNVGHGIDAASDSLIIGNVCDGNGFASAFASGIYVTGEGCRIEGNSVLDNDQGLTVDGTGNLVIRNSASGNTNANYAILSGNMVGVTVVAPTSGLLAGSSGGAGVGTTDPWGNISY